MPDDAARPVDAAPLVDARPDAPPDAPDFVQVQIAVMGPGTVTLVGSGICTKTCTLLAEYGQPATVKAEAADKNMFAGWTSMTCMGQPATCTFVPVAPVTISARFMKAD